MRRRALGFVFAVLAAGAAPIVAGCGKTDTTDPLVTPPANGMPCSPVGASIPADDSCGTCICYEGGWQCSTIPCTTMCTPGAMTPADDGCNTCTCMDGGVWGCTNIACVECTPGDGGCEWRCPLPNTDVDCDANPIWARSDASDLCCQFACPAAAPTDWLRYSTREECEAPTDFCPIDFENCNGDPADGCETDLSLPDSCGGCEQVCANPHGTAACSNGACTLTCTAGYDDCNGDASDGCEIDLSNDPNHCGSCGNVCPGINGTGYCQDSECGILCAEGYNDCNDDASDGCEVNMLTDLNNCGGCNLVCLGPDPRCVQGSCGIE